MTPELKEQIIKRLKSLAWRLGMMAVAGLLTIALETLPNWEVNPAVTVILGLVFGEASKYINSYLQAKREAEGMLE